jgi:glycosyltransferase 2 family protein
MLAGKKDKASSTTRRLMPWLNLLLVLILLGIGIWYLSDKVSLVEIGLALRHAKPLPILLGFGIVLLTLLMKAWRWQFMFAAPHQKPTFSASFWALLLGQYVNLIVPFLRLGEIARIYALNRQTSIPMATSIGTLVIEKVLDLLSLVITFALLMPLIILPEFVGQPGPLLWVVPILSLLALYFFAFETERITKLLQNIAGRLPENWIQRPFRWMISGLEGLAALRSGRTSLIILLLTSAIAVLMVLLPYVLFAAFDLELNLVQAALIHVVVTIAITPPSTPGKLGVFNGVVAIMLYSFGVSDNAAIISYSIVFYLVAILPQIVLGSIAAVKTDWHWQSTVEQQPFT